MAEWIARKAADALVDALNAETWPVDFEAVRTYVPRFRVEELGSLKVSVVPVESEHEAARTLAKTATVSIGFQKQVPIDSCDEVDELVDLAETIGDRMAEDAPGDFAYVSHSVTLVDDQIEALGVCSVALTVTLRAWDA